MKTLHFGIENGNDGDYERKGGEPDGRLLGTGWGTTRSHDTWTAADDLGRTWKAMSDSSIQAQEKSRRTD